MTRLVLERGCKGCQKKRKYSMLTVTDPSVRRIEKIQGTQSFTQEYLGERWIADKHERKGEIMTSFSQRASIRLVMPNE